MPSGRAATFLTTAAGIDDADLADAAETMIGTYTHALGRSHDRIRRLIG